MFYKRIVCAVDFSDASTEAFRQAADLAGRYGAQLKVIHALEAHPVFNMWLSPDSLGEITVGLQERAREAMEAFLDRHREELKGISCTSEISSGAGFEEILEHARVWSADLIVIGATGAAALDQIIIGSTVSRVLEGASCSVLVVKG